MTGLLKALGEFFKGQNKIRIEQQREKILESIRKEKKELKRDPQGRNFVHQWLDDITRREMIEVIPLRIEFLRGWKKNANPSQLKYYKLFAPVYFPDRESLADSQLLHGLITAINVKCKEDRAKLKAPKPRWIQG